MPLAKPSLFLLLGYVLPLSSCIAVSAVDTVGSVAVATVKTAATAVKTTVDVATGAVEAVTP